MRITLHPGLDLDLAPGSRLGDLRAALAQVACRPELASAPLEVDGVLLGDDHRVGSRPLLPGAVLRPVDRGPTARTRRPRPTTPPSTSGPPADPDLAALRAPWHVAVLAGPGCGDLLALTPGAPLVLGRAGGRSVVVTLGGRDRRRRRGPARGAGVRVRVRPARGRRPERAPDRTVRRETPAGRPRRLVPGATHRWRPGHTLQVGAATYDLRQRPLLDEWDVSSGLGAPHADTSRGGPSTSMVTMAITPAVGSLALAASTRQPLFALLALVGPLMLLLPLLARRRPGHLSGRGTHAGHRGHHGLDPDDRPGLDAVATTRHDGSREHRGSSRRGSPGPPHPARHGERSPVPGSSLDHALHPVPHPADLMTAAVAAHHATDREQRPVRPATGEPPPGAADNAPEAVGTQGAQGARLPDGCVAVVGPRAGRLAAARALLLAQVASGAEVDAVHPDDLAADWAWLRWLPGARRNHVAPVPHTDGLERSPRGRVTVVDAPAGRSHAASAMAASLETWWARRGSDERLILLAPDPGAVPAWCRTSLDTSTQTWHLADGALVPTPEVGVRGDQAERFARHVGAAAVLGRWPAGGRPGPTSDPTDPTHPDLAPTVSLAGLLRAPLPPAPGPTTAWVLAGWSTTDEVRAGLVVPLGTDARGHPVHVDLVRDGPHALVAGTTGAGKSELLQALVLGLALTHSPQDLALALVDFKGGAGFGRCADLPHVVGQVTDLEPGLAGRALAGLRAELRRREHAVADAGVSDVDGLPRGTLPRLVVVIDEFRALAEDLPDFLPGLLRLAAQGRSLGVHLVLATQRPAGAVSADMRANISLRLALRQIDPGDSRDVIDSPHAARIPARRPGRAVLRRGDEPPLALQCAHAGTPAPPRDAQVRAAPQWGPRPAAAAATAAPTDLVGLLVAAACDAARAARLAAHAPPWLPALPERVLPSDLRDGVLPAALPADALPLALSDLPDQQRRGLVSWRPDDGHLALVGRPRSGRSTALRALAVAALDRGWDVHLVGDAPALLEGLRGHPRCGTVVPRHDPRRVARLVELLLRREKGPPVLVLLDDVEDLGASLARLASGAGAEVLGRLLGEGPARGVHVALASGSPGLGGLARRVGPRLVLASDTVPDDVAHGVPSRLAGRGGRPGRAVWLGAGGAVECQVVVDVEPGQHVGAGRGGVGDIDGARGADEAADPVRLLPLPQHVTEAEMAAAHQVDPSHDQPSMSARGGQLVVGLGGDHAGPVSLDIARGALVVGPGGSGRSSALLLLARAAAAAGRLRAVLSSDERFDELVPRHGTNGEPAGGAPGPDAAAPFVAATGARAPLARAAALRALAQVGLVPDDVVVVDDLDLLVQALPLDAELLTDLVRAGVAVLASTSTTAAAMSHRGPVAELRAGRCGLVLGADQRGSAEVFGGPLGWAVDPDGAPPGRAVVVRGTHLVPVQVAAPGNPDDLSDSISDGLSGRDGP